MKGFCLEVAGEFACFTRPEMKVERVSYDVITPSAGRAIFSAILWKPAICWRITKIEVLNPIRWATIRRNEVTSVAAGNPICIEEARAQRASLLLRDVRYRLHAEFDFIPPQKRAQVRNPAPTWLADQEERDLEQQAAMAGRPDESAAKYAAMFARRAGKGQHFMQPYLGCREFACTWQLVDPVATGPAPIPESRDLGFMLYDLDYTNPKDIRPMFYRPQLQAGVILVPHPDSAEVLR